MSQYIPPTRSIQPHPETVSTEVWSAARAEAALRRRLKVMNKQTFRRASPSDPEFSRDQRLQETKHQDSIRNQNEISDQVIGSSETKRDKSQLMQEPRWPTPRQPHSMAPHPQLLPLTAMLGMTLILFCITISGCNGDVQSAQIMGKLLKSMQISACDGEIMRIKCREDYTIEVLTAEQTIIPAPSIAQSGNNSVKDTLMIERNSSAKLDSQATLSSSSSSSSDTSQYCPPTNTNNYSSQQQLIDHQQTLATGNGPAANIVPASACNADEANRRALSRETFVKFVRNECHLRNSCQLDLRWPQARSPSNLATDANQTQIEPTNRATNNNIGPIPRGTGISRVFNEMCPYNRKLAEVIYKCRPQKLTKRTVCRGGELDLECPQDKRLIFAWASFGAWANDTKTHERCSSEQQQQQHQLPGSSPVSNVGPLMRNCLANETFAVLANACAFKESCKLPVEPTALGQTNCPQGQVEYMKVIFTCVNETLIARSTSMTAPTNGSSSYVAASSGSSSMARTRLISAQAGAPRDTGEPASSSASMNSTASSISAPAKPMVASQPQQKPRGSLVINVQASSGVAQSEPADVRQPTDDDDSQQQPILPTDSNQEPNVGSTFTMVSHDEPQLHSRPTRNSNHWNLEQSARYVMAHYQQLLPLAAMLCLSMILIAFTIRNCNGTRQATNSSVDGSRASSKDSKDSSVGKSSASSGFKSLGSSAGLLQNGPGSAGSGSGLGGGPLAALKHHSFSESCFSLDDTDFGADDSPGLPSQPAYGTNYNLDTCMDSAFANNQYQYQQPAGTGAGAVATSARVRPKLWTIHNHHQQHYNHNNSLHRQNSISAQQAELNFSNTLRSHTRTFVGHQAANTQLHPSSHQHQQQQPHSQPQPQPQSQPHPVVPRQFSYQQLGAVSNAADLLLAMATNHNHNQNPQQQQQQLQAMAPNWCATLAQGQADESLANQLSVLMQPPEAAPATNEISSTTAAGADNQAATQQQQQQISQQMEPSNNPDSRHFAC